MAKSQKVTQADDCGLRPPPPPPPPPQKKKILLLTLHNNIIKTKKCEACKELRKNAVSSFASGLKISVNISLFGDCK